MNRGIYAPASGMMNNERLLDIVANNLANSNTTGFKKDGMTFKEAVERQMNSDGGQGDSLGSIGLGTDAATQYTSMEIGPTNVTNRPLDLAINSEGGMFAVQTDQGIQFTRDGSLMVNADGVLTTNTGKPVLDSNLNPISVPQGELSISNDGTVTVTSAGKTTAAGQIAIFTGNFTKVGANCWNCTNPTVDTTIKVQSGALEGSNVNPIEEMVNLINIGRTYELQQKTVAQQDELNQKLTTAMN